MRLAVVEGGAAHVHPTGEGAGVWSCGDPVRLKAAASKNPHAARAKITNMMISPSFHAGLSEWTYR